MGICPRCGSWVDEGEEDDGEDDKTVTIDGRDYDADEVKRVLENYCYTLEDLEYGRIDDEDLENIIDDLW